MSICGVCFKSDINSNLKTIGDQYVCSLSCVAKLKSNSKDSCNYCRFPVWKDNYYKINNKYYCSENCKNKIIKNLKIPYDSKLIQHFQENIFSNNDNDNNNVELKNSKQLREEVLKFYKDFHFDTIVEEEKDTKNNIEIDKDINYKKIIRDKDKQNNYKTYNTNNIYNNNRATSTKINKHAPNKNYASPSIKEKEKDGQNGIKKTRTINTDRYKNNINNFKTSNYKNNKNENIIIKRSEKVLTSKYDIMDDIDKNKNYSYSFVNTTDNPRKMSTFYTSNNNYNNYTNKNRNETNNSCNKSPIMYNKQNKCMKCGNSLLGRAKIFDRNNNAYCSDYCKEYYLSYY